MYAKVAFGAGAAAIPGTTGLFAPAGLCFSALCQPKVIHMALPPPLVLTLTQNKLYTGVSPRTERFGVQSRLVASVATDQQLEAAFILGPATGVDRERLLRVLNLSHAPDQVLLADPGSVNELKYFKDPTLDLTATVQIGDVVRVSTPPGEWSAALPATMDFTVTALDLTPNFRLVFAEPFLWSAENLTFTVYQSNLVTVRVPTRTTGRTEREDTGAVEWRCDRFTAAFDTSTEALDHIASIQAYVASLSQQAILDVQEFLDVGGNPIVTVY